jgi:drug/metabolite transporter (DMT)-like permease
MTPVIIAAVLGAAVLHASWNAVLRGRADRLWSITLMCLMSAVIAVPLVVVLPAPAIASWPFIALSACLQIAYCLTLVRAYRHGLLAEIYPIARGVSPMLVTLGAWMLAAEKLTGAAIGGVALVSCGIVGIALGRARPEPRAVLAALATGMLVAGYTVTDGLGGRGSGAPASYAAWLFLVQGASMPLVFWALRRRPPSVRLDGETLKSLIGGAVSLVSYGVVIWALSLAPMGQVSALRETGILFAMVIGVLFLKERPTARQILSGVMIAGGAFLISSAG